MAGSVPNAGRSPFAHLARTAPLAAESDDDKEKRDEELRALEDDGKDTDETEDEKKARHAREAKRAKKAEEDKKKEEEAKKAEEDKKKDEEARRAKKAEDGDDDSDREDEDDAGMRAARRRERGRLRAIILSDAGKANPVGAMHLATETSMTRSAVIATLSAMNATAAPAAPPRDALRDRMSTVANHDIGGGDGDRAPTNLAAQIVAAGKKRRGEV